MADEVAELAAELERLDRESLADMALLDHRERVAAAAVVWALFPDDEPRDAG